MKDIYICHRFRNCIQSDVVKKHLARSSIG